MSRLFIYDENMTDERAKITVAKMAAISDIVAPEKSISSTVPREPLQLWPGASLR